MMGFGQRSQNRSLPELLAAYADGELDAVGRARVEAWLADHPEARAELEALRQLSRHNQKLWQASSGPAPSAASWSRLFTRVQQALSASPRSAAAGAPPGPAAARRPRLLRALAPLAAAAALVAFALVRPPSAPPVLPTAPDGEAWAVATTDDIAIVSIQEVDTALLVVGEPPLPGPVVLASAGDVALENIAPDSDGMMPQVLMQPGPNAPMIIAPMAGR